MKLKPSLSYYLHVCMNSLESRHLWSFKREMFLPNSPTMAIFAGGCPADTREPQCLRVT
jgi:hypothetical protein